MRRLWAGWQRFWFTPQPATTLGVVRIGFGVLVVAWTLSLLPDLTTLFGEDGPVPNQAHGRFAWSVLDTWTSPQVLWIVWSCLIVSAIALTVGWHSRLAAVVVFACILSFERRNMFVFNAGDDLLRIEAFLLMLAPTGAALSLDQRRRTGTWHSAELHAPWVLRLMQIQLSVVYGFTVLEKLSGATWQDGTAVSYALRLTDLTTVATPTWLSTNGILMNLATWGTLCVELCLAVLVWNRRCRPWVLGVGVVFHLVILTSLAVAFFSFAMFVLYLAFIPPETIATRPRLPWSRGRPVAPPAHG